MKTIAYIALAFAAAFLLWLWHFAATGLDETKELSMVDAYTTAKSYAAVHGYNPPRYVVRATEGASNSFLGTKKRGYYILDTQAKFADIKANDFAIRKDEDRTILHRVRVKSNGGWIMEGDGNLGPDRNLLTSDNLKGLVVERKVWRY